MMPDKPPTARHEIEAALADLDLHERDFEVRLSQGESEFAASMASARADFRTSMATARSELQQALQGLDADRQTRAATLSAMPLDGGCRCGRVRFRLTERPWMEAACHCRGCQRMTGSAFSTTLVMPKGGFALVAGDTVIGGMHGDEADHHHCDWCKSWVFTAPRADLGFVNVRATLLDDAAWFAPYMETQTAEMLPWAVTGASRSFAHFPEMDAYQDLIAEYRGARDFG